MGGSALAGLGTPAVCQPHLPMGTLTTSLGGRSSFHQAQIPPLHLGGCLLQMKPQPPGKAQATSVPLGAWTSVPRWTPGPERGGRVVAAGPDQLRPSQLS